MPSNSVFPKERCFSDKKEKYILEVPKKLRTFTPGLFDSIVPQIAEIRTVTNSLPLKSENSVKSLFFDWLSRTDKNCKYNKYAVFIIFLKIQFTVNHSYDFYNW